MFFKKDGNKEYQLVNLTLEGKLTYQNLRLRNKLVLAVKSFNRWDILSSVQFLTKSKGLDEPFKLVHRVVDVVDRGNRNSFVTLLWYSVDKPKNSYAQVPVFVKKTGNENFQEKVYVNFEIDDFHQLIDVRNCLKVKVFANQSNCNFSIKNNCNHLVFFVFLLIESR